MCVCVCAFYWVCRVPIDMYVCMYRFFGYFAGCNSTAMIDSPTFLCCCWIDGTIFSCLILSPVEKDDRAKLFLALSN
ncbi:Uncharacterized protein APZ42_012081 [Daphnia magna]|uniref:Uncharacterized protein n=1 Tax=Daphnia magna TaxID=35525 RepID=A0A162S2A8_9CRUS|nr:Uncharacterized protein APZ42_012081 [Daphnia magna]